MYMIRSFVYFLNKKLVIVWDDHLNFCKFLQSINFKKLYPILFFYEKFTFCCVITGRKIKIFIKKGYYNQHKISNILRFFKFEKSKIFFNVCGYEHKKIKLIYSFLGFMCIQNAHALLQQLKKINFLLCHNWSKNKNFGIKNIKLAYIFFDLNIIYMRIYHRLGFTQYIYHLKCLIKKLNFALFMFCFCVSLLFTVLQ